MYPSTTVPLPGALDVMRERRDPTARPVYAGTDRRAEVEPHASLQRRIAERIQALAPGSSLANALINLLASRDLLDAAIAKLLDEPLTLTPA